MHLTDTALPDVKIVTLDTHRDARGLFCERFSTEKFASLGLPTHFVQDNWSRSLPGVIRGLHFQYAPAQGKLVGVTRGRVLDVAVDIRPHSPHFGKHVSVELSDENGKLLWIPQGFAHGFCVLGNEVADVVYKLTAHYRACGEQGIAYNDSSLAIAWPTATPILSARDQSLPSLCALRPQLAAWFSA